MVEVVFENFVNYLRSGNTDKLNIISFQQNQQHKINLSTQLIFYRILTKTVVQLKVQDKFTQIQKKIVEQQQSIINTVQNVMNLQNQLLSGYSNAFYDIQLQ
ncbi:Hypothetical_protein [Hexamita inflata]|uniref:Hypothetical_protein n=1 Tax=Hexamita inflata TaxID=28002 RepID=A0AA86UEF2_9EUKA|nr:Hypothetical protein HINF_LOCUS25638 [Hexamita inflata]